MGVMSCYRAECESIMCDYYATEFGYICNDCLQELRDYQKQHPEMTLTDIKEWMSKPKGYVSTQPPLIDLDSIFILG